jgi:hypothetical protein
VAIDRLLPPRRTGDDRQLINALTGLSVAAGELFEDDALIIGKLFTHGGDQQHTPWQPEIAF